MSRTRLPNKLLTSLFAIITVAVLGFAVVDASSAGAGASARSKLTIMAPAAPGGGWDAFAREAQQAMRANGIVNNAQVVNVPGAGGTIGLSQLLQMQSRDDLLMVTGGVMVGATVLSNTGESLADTVPIARLADDYNALVVPASSPYSTLEEFVEGMKADPGKHSIAGGSLGGIDHLLSGMLGKSIGVDPKDVNYVAYSGGGEVLSSLLSSTTAAGLSGYNEFRDQIEAGTLKALAISAPEPVDGIDIPTFKQEGVDVAMVNWRGVVAPPGIDDATRDELIDIVTELENSPEWAEALDRNNWTDSFQPGTDFEDFLVGETDQVTALVKELGL
uniref:Bug family tripartite tricarboxylate transporter substrate binding protein n=1 Tax=Pseudoclavibacter sp. RFBI5 TaxID=2080578 RepID=UPI0015E42BBE|nr:tripartite tricarboxylate transporter substrate-binding protein [Pseudoclavibacter sp. RFBI5]